MAWDDYHHALACQSPVPAERLRQQRDHGKRIEIALFLHLQQKGISLFVSLVEHVHKRTMVTETLWFYRTFGGQQRH
jgi:hypothetical protein